MPRWAKEYRGRDWPAFAYTADTLVFKEVDGDLKVLLIERGGEPYRGMWALPGGFVDRNKDVDARVAALRELEEEAGISSVTYMEALDVYDAAGRDPREFCADGVRVVSKAWICLVPGDCQARAGSDARRYEWQSVYDILPWEDRRLSGSCLRQDMLALQLKRIAATKQEKNIIDEVWGIKAEWNEERVGERYAMLATAGMVEEALRDCWGQVHGALGAGLGKALAFDHRQMVADALGRLRGKMKYMPSIMAGLVQRPFTVSQITQAVEAVGGRELWGSNYMRSFSKVGLDVMTVVGQAPGGGKRGPKAKLFDFVEPVAVRRLQTSVVLPWKQLG